MIAALIADAGAVLYPRNPAERAASAVPLRIMLGQFVTLFRQKRVLCYMVASGFSFAGCFRLSAGHSFTFSFYGLTELEFGYCFALNIVFLFIATTINSRYVRRFWCTEYAAHRSWWCSCWPDAGWYWPHPPIRLCGSDDDRWWPLCGNIAMITSNAMAVILDDYPHMAGTASSLAGVLRFGSIRCGCRCGGGFV